MPKKISIENYSRRRGFSTHTVKMKQTTAAGRGFDEYFNLLNLGAESPHAGTLEYLKRCEELKTMQEK
jgi:hypothetical protein